MRTLWTPRWLLVHAAAAVLVVGFLALGWWQVNRATGGNVLSFGYAVEWPAFAAFVVFVWVKEMRQALRAADPHPAAPRPAAAPVRRAPGTRVNPAAYDDSDDDELMAYNHYLAWLNANPHLSPSHYPGYTR
jgi:hypothetical protein